MEKFKPKSLWPRQLHALTLGPRQARALGGVQQPVGQLGRPKEVAPELLSSVHVPGSHGDTDPFEMCEFRLALCHGSQDPGGHCEEARKGMCVHTAQPHVFSR